MIYLLSILDGLNGTAIWLSIVSGIGALAWTIAYFVASAADDSAAKSGALYPRSQGPIVLPTIAPARLAMAKRLGTASIALAIVAGFVPSRDALIRAYLMVEGSKLVTADNAQKTTEEIVKRIDAVLARFGVKP